MIILKKMRQLWSHPLLLDYQPAPPASLHLLLKNLDAGDCSSAGSAPGHHPRTGNLPSQPVAAAS